MFQLLILLVSFFLFDCSPDPGTLARYVGVGYDAAVGNPKTHQLDTGFRIHVFKQTFLQNKRTEDRRFLVPDLMWARGRDSCSFVASTEQYTGLNSYQRSLRALVSASADVNAFLFRASFSASAEFNITRDTIEERDSMVFDSQASCELYALNMDFFNPPPLSDGFRNAIMIAADDINNTRIWNNIIRTYGTHFITHAIFGGRMNIQSRVTRSSVQELTAMGIDVRFAAGLRYKVVTGNRDIEVEANLDVLNSFERKAGEYREIYIGGRPPRNGNRNEWVDSLFNSTSGPLPVAYTVFDLSELISRRFFNLSSEKLQILKKTLDETITTYCKRNGCNPPGVDLPFPPSITVFPKFTPYVGSPIWDFQDELPPRALMNVRKIRCYMRRGISGGDGSIRPSELVGMRFFLNDTRNSHMTPLRGTLNSGTIEWEVPQAECITQIEVFWDGRDLIHGFQARTNVGNLSPIFGSRPQGSRHTLFTLQGNLVGIRGRVDGSSLFRSLSFLTARRRQ